MARESAGRKRSQVRVAEKYKGEQEPVLTGGRIDVAGGPVVRQRRTKSVAVHQA